MSQSVIDKTNFVLGTIGNIVSTVMSLSTNNLDITVLISRRIVCKINT